LITIAQAIHWFDPEKIYPYLADMMRPLSEETSPTKLMLLSYRASLEISYGENWKKIISQDIPGYSITNGCPDY